MHQVEPCHSSEENLMGQAGQPKMWVYLVAVMDIISSFISLFLASPRTGLVIFERANSHGVPDLYGMFSQKNFDKKLQIFLRRIITLPPLILELFVCHTGVQ